MVNLQDSSEFACQALNRDLWSNSSVKDLIREYFVFLQYWLEAPEGERYRNYYPVEHFPHIAIIDPRTGERVHQWDVALSPGEFLQYGLDSIRGHLIC